MKVWVLNPPYLPKYSRPQRSPAVTKSGTLYFPIWLAYCAAVLEQNGHDVVFTDAPARGLTPAQTLKIAQGFRPRLVVMDVSTPSVENDMGVAEQIKALLPDGFILMVGPHVSALAGETLAACPSADAVARREYEHTVKELAGLLARQRRGRGHVPEFSGIRGLSFRKEGRIIHHPDRPYIKNLDDLPWVSPVYKKHLRIRDYFNPNALYPMVTLVTSRGCPFRCSFCVYPQTFSGHAYRFRSIDEVCDEMAFVIREIPEARSVFFEDDTLTANKKRCLAFANAIRTRDIRIPWTANSRIDPDFETLRAIRAAGCRELCVGFESGSQAMLNAMGKGVNLQKSAQFMADARRAGIFIHGCFMIGFPGEGPDEVEQTIDLAMRLNPDTAQFYPVMVYPGTKAYAEYAEKGWLTARAYRDWLTPDGLHNCVVKNEHFTSAELVKRCDAARRRFYLRPRYMAYKLRQMLEKPTEIIRTAKAGRTFFKHLLLGSRL